MELLVFAGCQISRLAHPSAPVLRASHNQVGPGNQTFFVVARLQFVANFLNIANRLHLRCIRSHHMVVCASEKSPL